MSYRFSYKIYRLPLRTPLRTAHGWWAEREGIMIYLPLDPVTAPFSSDPRFTALVQKMGLPH